MTPQRTGLSGAVILLLLGTCAMPAVQAEQGGTPLPPRQSGPVPAPLPAKPDLAANPFRLDGLLQQGAVVRGVAPAGTQQLLLNGEPLPLAADGAFIIAFDRDAPNAAVLVAQLADGGKVERYLPVRPGNWRIEQVNASPTGGVTTAEFQRLRAGELAQINAARRMNVRSDGWRQRFIWPVKARISGLFGSQRIYRGSPGSYHSGVDVAGGQGTAFVAPADGVVILAAQTPFTLEGHLLMVDHGMGLNSAFLHCSRLDVKVGDVVRQGQVLGAIGATGRASGPHLHWGMKWNNARIDPMLLAGAM
jgi:Peptidase family M23